jgi:endogenous inhibitor of DNA gyrase (YacG/DUF329 family)
VKSYPASPAAPFAAARDLNKWFGEDYHVPVSDPPDGAVDGTISGGDSGGD